ncbi:hypothetical protein HGRIS_007662 [Hohenbuehelia grisea]|uniref:Uncharacterized protein n=1 Tax=Hohenbuehelia grisea TaxID=104357 RepID=A0ABR3J5W6_9AGAR
MKAFMTFTVSTALKVSTAICSKFSGAPDHLLALTWKQEPPASPHPIIPPTQYFVSIILESDGFFRNPVLVLSIHYCYISPPSHRSIKTPSAMYKTSSDSLDYQSSGCTMDFMQSVR